MSAKLTGVILAGLVILIGAVNSKKETDFNDDDIIRFESSSEDLFQPCLLSCIDRDLCCSCKESDKLSMNAAMINDFSKNCATKDVLECSKDWINSWINAERSEASNCTTQAKVEGELGKCIRQCKGREWSKPLDPYLLGQTPRRLEKNSDLLNYEDPDYNDFCSDLRACGLMCTVYCSHSYTAGNTLCRHGNRCGYHGYGYSWCYVDFSGGWDYCCTGPCSFGQGTNYLWCRSGTKWQYCGNAGTRDIIGRRCTKHYPCGMHQEVGKASYYWCYVDANKNWGKCCEPWYRCSLHSENYNWCYTGYKKKTDWHKCRRV